MIHNEEPSPVAERYCIYARRSSDEKSGKQYKSIPDQLKFCQELAETAGIRVEQKYIFTESASAKKANNRPVFSKMLDLIRKGELDGIIAWHPDRLSRNMYEAGVIIDLIDEGKISDLKFCIHHFENSPSGKMMLGILFAISKEYSDRLSLNISRGLETNLEVAISTGAYKWGFERNDEGYYDPHPKFYSIVQEVWRMRLKDKGFADILLWLETMDCNRIVEKKDEHGNKIENTYTIGKSTLTRMFRDPFYYGVLQQNLRGKVVTKLIRDYYPDFQPMVTEEEWNLVQRMGRSRVKLKTKQQFPFRGNLIRCSCGSDCFPTTGSSDGGKNLYLYIVCRAASVHREKKQTYRMRSKIVLEAIADRLRKDFKPSKATYERYAATMRRAIESDLADGRKRKAALGRRQADAEKGLDALVVGVLGKTLDTTEKRVYEQKKFSYEEIIRQCKKDRAEIEQGGILQTFSYEEFSNFLKHADLYWKRADADQKHALARFLFSNIKVGGGKVLQLAYKPLIRDLFVSDGGDAGKKLEPV